MPDEQPVAQLRARLISLRGQRKRLASRAIELDRRGSAAVASAREELDAARTSLGAIHVEVAERRAQIDYFERSADAPAQELADWQRVARAAVEGLRRAEEQRSVLEARAADADARLALTIRQQEAATTDQTKVSAALDREIELLQRAISDLQSALPLPEAPDPRLRDALVDRLRLLDEERAWVQEEIAMRDERLRRLTAEASQVRSLLELHTPEWARELFPQSPADVSAERTTPAWRSAVVEMLRQAGEPLHYRDIAAALTRSGQGLGGQDPAETLLAALSRDTGFVRPARGLYWLADRPLPRRWSAPETARLSLRADRRTREARQP